MNSKNYEESGYSHHLALIARFISYEKWMQRKNAHLRPAYLSVTKSTRGQGVQIIVHTCHRKQSIKEPPNT